MNRICTALSFSLLFTAGLSASTIHGTVKVDGPTPKRKVIDMSKEPACAKDYSPTDPPRTEAAIAGQGGGLADVVVYISEGANDAGVVPKNVVTLDQKGCRYIKHVTALHTNQALQVANSDPALHNVHAMAEENKEFNASTPAGSKPLEAKFAQAEFIPVKCNVHPWMHGYIAVLSTNHYDVTSDSGNFDLKDLPPGKYTITAWSETFGTQTQQVVIGGAKETKSISFTFKGKAY